MAFIPGYEYDIFISYAHVDNLAFPGQADGWIEQFYKNLNLMLAKRFGRLDMIKIWWDTHKLDGSKLFDDSIEDGIRKSAIMICLNSPGYLQSAYCKQELDLFYKKASAEKQRLKIGDRSRIINVLLNNIPYNEWPTGLTGATGFPFHDAEKTDDFGETVDTLSAEFRTQLQKLRDAVFNLLTEFQKTQAGTASLQEPVESREERFNIYLGEVADTLRTPKKRLIAELEKN
ncbi:MAG TPA: toll/interleukin-1 receptor domain-containing protein, partial [Ferruginibacter sp.]|nr:toll/interleukin-1 receptor domain-containing protein [Ferruginibacter sp.]